MRTLGLVISAAMLATAASAQLRPLTLTLEQSNYLGAELFAGGSDDILTVLTPRIVVNGQVGVEAFNSWDDSELDPGNSASATAGLMPIDSDAKAADLHTLRTMRSIGVVSGVSTATREIVIGGRIDNFPNSQAEAATSYVALLTEENIDDLLGEGAGDEIELLAAIENNAIVPANQRIALDGSAGLNDADLDDVDINNGVLIEMDQILADYGGALDQGNFSAFIMVLKDNGGFDGNDADTFQLTEIALIDSTGPGLVNAHVNIDENEDICLFLEFDFPVTEDLLPLFGTDPSDLDDPGTKLRVRDAGSSDFFLTLESQVEEATMGDADPWTAGDEGYQSAFFEQSDSTKRTIVVKFNTDDNSDQAQSILDFLTTQELRPSTGAASMIVDIKGDAATNQSAPIAIAHDIPPVLLKPRRNATNVPSFLGLSEFRWNNVAPFVSNRLIVSEQPDLSNPVIDRVVTGEEISPPGGLEKSTRYYWAVEATTVSGTALSEIRTFSTVLLGDVNFDGVVDFSDLNEVLVGFGQDGP